MKPEEIREQLDGRFLKTTSSEEMDNVLLFDGFNDALIGIGGQAGSAMVAIYDFYKLVHVCVEDMGMQVDEAVEHIGFNVESAYVGEQTPFIVHVTSEELEVWFDGNKPDTEDTEAPA